MSVRCTPGPGWRMPLAAHDHLVWWVECRHVEEHMPTKTASWHSFLHVPFSSSAARLTAPNTQLHRARRLAALASRVNLRPICLLVAHAKRWRLQPAPAERQPWTGQPMLPRRRRVRATNLELYSYNFPKVVYTTQVVFIPLLINSGARFDYLWGRIPGK